MTVFVIRLYVACARGDSKEGDLFFVKFRLWCEIEYMKQERKIESTLNTFFVLKNRKKTVFFKFTKMEILQTK